MNFLRKSGTSVEIDNDGLEYECNILFLWSKKNNSVTDSNMIPILGMLPNDNNNSDTGTVKRHTSEEIDMDSALG